MEITLEQIKNKFDELPEEVRWAVIEAKIDDVIIEIGQTSGLNVSQMGQLALETYAVIVGFTAPDNFENSVKASLGLGEEKTKKLVAVINQKVLKQIREKMMAQKSVPSPFKKSGLVSSDDSEKNIASIPAQRLMGSFKMPNVNTDHGLGVNKNTSENSVVRKIDPYREIPE